MAMMVGEEEVDDGEAKRMFGREGDKVGEARWSRIGTGRGRGSDWLETDREEGSRRDERALYAGRQTAIE
jgi:hypothetical protein